MSEWNFDKNVISEAQEIGIGDRVMAHWSEAEAQDQEGTVVGVNIYRRGVIDYTVHLDGDESPTDGFYHDSSGHDAGTIRLISSASNTLIEEQAARIADLEAQVSKWRQKWEEDDRDVRYFSKAMKAQQDRDASQARLSEAVKVLEPIVAVFDASAEHARARGKDPDTTPDEHEITPFQDVPNLTIGHLRAIKAFITTLGGEK